MNLRTDCLIQKTYLTVIYMYSTVVRSDWFHCCITVYEFSRVFQLSVIIILIVK